MSKVLISGDMHGYEPAIRMACNLAQGAGCKQIFQAGDFGLWNGLRGIEWLDDVSHFAALSGVTLFALGGNHEAWPIWNEYMSSPNAVRHKETGGVYVRSNVVLLPRATTFDWFGRKWAVACGAASIDKNMRTAGKDWWPEEELTDAEADSLQSKVDILLTHDASNYTPWGFQLIPGDRYLNHRNRIDRVIKNTSPEVHFHGHYHIKYDWLNQGFSWRTRTYGLTCNGAPNSNGVLDTRTLDFEWLE